jgi:ATP-dependent RNA helicase RhlE
MKEPDLTAFSDFNLLEPIQRALADESYSEPTPIQVQAIPHVLAGRDIMGCAQTGTGKTAAFALPMLQRFATDRRNPGPRAMRALILAPTRELASQIAASFAAYGRHVNLSHAVVFGGVGQHPQVRALARGLDILVATPGRLLDLIEQGHARLDRIEVFVLDEADRMLDMGFINDIRKIVRLLPQKRQTLMFSATMPDDIARLAANILREPVKVAVAAIAQTADRIEQSLLFVARGDKPALLADLLKDKAIVRALVFTRTKHGANKVVEQLQRARVTADAIHGNKSQPARERALADFRSGRIRVLVATDIAARGIDIDGITHVFNYDLPNIPESYVHRIGRTARAGAAGIAISFCDNEERAYLRDIERLIRQKVTVQDHPLSARANEQAPRSAPHGRSKPSGRDAPRGNRHPPRGRTTSNDRHPSNGRHAPHDAAAPRATSPGVVVLHNGHAANGGPKPNGAAPHTIPTGGRPALGRPRRATAWR